MPVTSYGAYNPNAVDPWPIEQTLAPLAVGGSQAEAQNMLNMYQKQREAAGNVYGDELARQHEFNRQQLAQQLYEAKLKEMAPLLNAPGGAHLLGQGGIPGMDMGTDPGTMQGIIGAADAAQQAKQFGEAGKGAEGFSNAGYMIAGNALPGLAPGTPLVQTENARLAAERIRANAMLGAASIRAAGGGGGAEPKVNISQPMPSTGEGDPATWGVRVPFSQAGDYQTRLQAEADRRRAARSGTGLPPAPGSPSAAPSGGGGGGDLPGRLDTSSPAGAKAQNDAMRTANQLSQAAAKGDATAKEKLADIQPAMDGNTYRTYKLPDGRIAIRGKTQMHVVGQ